MLKAVAPFLELATLIPLLQSTTVHVLGPLTAQATAVDLSSSMIAKIASTRQFRVKSNFNSLAQSNIGLFLKAYLQSQLRPSVDKVVQVSVAPVV